MNAEPRMNAPTPTVHSALSAFICGPIFLVTAECVRRGDDQAAATGVGWRRRPRALTRFSTASAIRSASRPTPWIIVDDIE